MTAVAEDLTFIGAEDLIAVGAEDLTMLIESAKFLFLGSSTIERAAPAILTFFVYIDVSITSFG